MDSPLKTFCTLIVMIAVGAFFAFPQLSSGWLGGRYSLAIYNTDAGGSLVQYGVTGSRVEYVAFVRDGTDNPSAIIEKEEGGYNAAGLRLPGEAFRPAPLESNVFELIDGVFREKRLKLDAEDVADYCRVPREGFSIAGLEAFIASK